jgi:hypothetical protein
MSPCLQCQDPEITCAFSIVLTGLVGKCYYSVNLFLTPHDFWVSRSGRGV